MKKERAGESGRGGKDAVPVKLFLEINIFVFYLVYVTYLRRGLGRLAAEFFGLFGTLT
jgi:hypothetical protein